MNLTALQHSPKHAGQGDGLARLLCNTPYAWENPSLGLRDEKRRAVDSAEQQTPGPGH